MKRDFFIYKNAFIIEIKIELLVTHQPKFSYQFVNGQIAC
jgi:hypothetical protein